MPDVTSGKEWSAADLQDLRDFLENGTPVEEIAVFLMRDVEEVKQQIELLGDEERPT
jgi:hypothetical protein